MNYLLYGPDTYRSRRKLHEIVDAYRARHGDSMDLHWVDAEERGFGAAEEAGGTASLFARKKMVAIERAIASGVSAQKLAAFLKKYKGSADVIVILWEENVDEKTKEQFVGALACADKSQEFGLLDGARLSRWIREEGERRGAALTLQDMARIAALGPDLWAIASEMEKIAVAVRGTATASTGGLCSASVFDLGDSFFSSRREAIKHLMTLMDQGEDGMGIFSYLTNHCRTLLILKLCAELREPVPPALGIHPFVIKKISRLVAGLERDVLLKTLRRFFDGDCAIKTGAKPEEAILRMLLG